MNPGGRNNLCGAKEQDRDASDWGKVIPAEQKSKIEMNPAGRNNPCGEKEEGRDGFSDGLPVMGCIRAGEIIPVVQKSKIEMNPGG